jgi:hypothetical protein
MLENQRIGVSLLAGGRDYSPFHSFQTNIEARLVLYLWERPTIQQAILFLQTGNPYTGNPIPSDRQSLFLQTDNLIPSIGDSLLPKTYGKAHIFIHYRLANQRSQQQREPS